MWVTIIPLQGGQVDKKSRSSRHAIPILVYANISETESRMDGR